MRLSIGVVKVILLHRNKFFMEPIAALVNRNLNIRKITLISSFVLATG